MIYLFDTNIIIHYLRGSDIMNHIENVFRPFEQGNEIWISVVSVGELKSIAIQAQWGTNRIDKLQKLLDMMLLVDIHSEDILVKYAEIDAYSQGKLPGQPLGMTARNMGKNDLWIAACAAILNATLLTTDADFKHLDGKFLDVKIF